MQRRSIIQKFMPHDSIPTLSAAVTPACDCHFHVFSAHQRAANARYVPAYDATLVDWERRAVAADVARGVVVQPSFLGTDHRQLLAALQLRPLTLRGVAVVAATANAAELQALHAQGVRGIRLNLAGVDNDVDALRALPASWWSALIVSDLHVELHSNAGRVAALLPLLPCALPVVLDHFGKPDRVAALDATVRVVRHRRHAGGATFVTLSGAYRQRVANHRIGAELTSLWLGEIGADQLLWGSDWPCTNFESEADYAALKDVLRDWLPAANDHRAAVAINAQRLYWR